MAKNLFSDYEGFVDKFKPKLTTDDCYTPQWCYDLILDYVDKKVMSLEGKRVLRPFWPGKDYQEEEYLPEDVVIDNPPFSILSQICDFYRHRGIHFFLFAPTLTLAGTAKDYCTAVVCAANITYANGANVNTSFVTNMIEGNPAIVVNGGLTRRIKEENDRAVKKAANALPRYDMPDGVLSAARLQKIANAGVTFRVERNEARFIRALDSQRIEKKTIFGGGWIVSREAAAREVAAREVAAREVAAREVAAREAAAREAIYWPLSATEEALMDSLGKHGESRVNVGKHDFY